MAGRRNLIPRNRIKNNNDEMDEIVNGTK